MGNGHMGTPLPPEQNETDARENTAFPQLRLHAAKIVNTFLPLINVKHGF